MASHKKGDKLTAKVDWNYTEALNSKVMADEVWLDGYRVVIVGDGQNGSYEWIIFAENGRDVVKTSNDGYGQIGIALYEGLRYLMTA